jgi:hypothetical protein
MRCVILSGAGANAHAESKDPYRMTTREDCPVFQPFRCGRSSLKAAEEDARISS